MSELTMSASSFSVETADWQRDGRWLRPIRETVFIVEQGVPEADEWDTEDFRAEHVLARDAEGAGIGTGRLTGKGQIGRLAVLAEWRGHGVGAAILEALLDRARARGLCEVFLHAQIRALGFYQRYGFVAEGPVYDECGIPHQTMRLKLEAAPANTAADGPRAGLSRLSADSAPSLRAASVALLVRARHHVCLYTRDLDPAVYDQQDVIDELRRIALSGRRAEIRILVQDTARVVQEGHRLIDLAQRLSSIIHLRRPTHEDLQYNAAFLLNDSDGYLYRAFGDRYEAEGDLAYAPRREELLRYFNEVWERAEPPPELRRLSL